MWAKTMQPSHVLCAGRPWGEWAHLSCVQSLRMASAAQALALAIKMAWLHSERIDRAICVQLLDGLGAEL